MIETASPKARRFPHRSRSRSTTRRSASFTLSETAALLCVSRDDVLRLIREGVLPAERTGRRWGVPRAVFAYYPEMPR